MIPKAEKTALAALKIKIQRQSWSPDSMHSEYFIEDNHITKLKLIESNLTSLPESFGNLENLSMLELDGCSLINLCNISLNCFKHHHRFAIFNLTSKGQSLYSSRIYEELLNYYKKTPSDLAQQYITTPDSLRVDEKERLIHEGGYLEKKILELKMAPDDPILKKILKRLDQFVGLLNGFKLQL